MAFSMRAFAEEDRARSFGNLVALYVRELSRSLDLSTLDGITVAFDYPQALLELDRGYPATVQLTPSRDTVTGIAMTPSVLRNGVLKSHIVLDAGYVMALEEPDHEFFGLSLHTLAHECAHVEITAAFDRAFPNVLLRERSAGMHEGMRQDIIQTCWDEYAVCSIVAGMGADPLPGYEETLVKAVGEARARANDFIRKYRVHADVGQMLQEVCGVYGNLLKFASYFAGTLAGQGKGLNDTPAAHDALVGHWFEPYYDRLTVVMAALAERYPHWESRSEFDPVADLFEDIVRAGGVSMTPLPDGGIYADVPFSAETMPLVRHAIR